MSISVTDNTRRCFSLGDGVRAQLVAVSAVSGTTSGTVTPSGLSKVDHCQMPPGFKHTAAPTFSNATATFAVVVQAETAATRTFQSCLLLTAVANLGASGNSVSLTVIGGGTAGEEVVTLVGSAITLKIEDGVSTADQAVTALTASAAAAARVTATAVAAHGSDALAVASVLSLTGGVTGGAYGDALFIGV